jgi:hypothetical protein
MAREVEGICTSSTSNPFFLNNPSSWATQVPLILLANDVHATRAFICEFAGADNTHPAASQITALMIVRALIVTLSPAL